MAVFASPARGADQLTAPRATDLARNAVLDRAIAVTVTGRGHEGSTITDIYRPRCELVSRWRASCRYRFAIVDDTVSGVTLYAERGWVAVRPRSQRAWPTMRATASRDGWPR